MSELEHINADILLNQNLLRTAERIHDDDSCQLLHGELQRLYRLRILNAKQAEQEMKPMTAGQHNAHPKGRWTL